MTLRKLLNMFSKRPAPVPPFPVRPLSEIIAARAERMCNRDRRLVVKYRRVHEILAAGDGGS